MTDFLIFLLIHYCSSLFLKSE